MEDNRLYQLNIGDIIFVPNSMIDDYKPKVGRYLTYCDVFKQFIPLFDTYYYKLYGKFVITKIRFIEYKWWKIWERKKIDGFELKFLGE